MLRRLQENISVAKIREQTVSHTHLMSSWHMVYHFPSVELTSAPPPLRLFSEPEAFGLLVS